MDHLTWLWELQQTETDGDLPELRRLQINAAANDADEAAPAAAAKTAEVSAAAAAAAMQELLAASLQTFSMQEAAAVLLRSSAAESHNAIHSAHTSSVFYGSAETHAEGSRPVIPGGGPTMEEISRFFEIDARRF